jgi:hypothetical protein
MLFGSQQINRLGETIMKNLFILIMTLGLFLTACDKSPMQKLESDTVYSDMNTAFWSDQHHADTALWKDAVAYCKAHEKKPNCLPIFNILLFTNNDSHFSSDKGHKIWQPKY